ncbi:MAG TPA: acetyl-CoA carboxylase carboxyltransferase subunit alpha [Chthonomonadales bacterium]|nr:acetyl-CoA carboxylase carboxyltransferase subunit alpha [Chthonomonadales bacterium]
MDVLEFERQIAEMERMIAELKQPARRAEATQQGIDAESEVAKLEGQVRAAIEGYFSKLSPWEKTQLARHKDRPYTLDYVRLVFEGFMEMQGDRLTGNDEAVVGGPAWLGGAPVVVIGQQKGRDIKERQRRNFGSARAEGFRKALRLARFAEKFGRPLISFVDTAGAAADLLAEERGVSEAIARNLREFARLRVPTVAVVIGEGGSGGALALAVADCVLMLEHAIYSVISPEGCAAILWRDRELAPRAAEALRLTAQDALRLGLVDGVVPEPLGGAHRDVVMAAEALKHAIEEHLGVLRCLSEDELVERRYARLRSIGKWSEGPGPGVVEG